MKYLAIVCALMVSGMQAAVTVASFDAPTTFKPKMATCFDNWDKLDTNDGFTPIEAIIKQILAASLGTDNIEITDKDGKKVQLARLIYDLYQKVPYHNICHGIMVSYYTYLFTKDLTPAPADSEIKALLFAGLLHDIGHNGYTNGNCGKVGSAKQNRFCKLTFATDGSSCVSNAVDANLYSKYTTGAAIHRLLPNVMTDYITEAHNTLAIWKTVYKVKKWTRPNNSEVTTEFQAFCGKAELQHAMIARAILNHSSVSSKIASDPQFLNIVVIAILHTDMELYGKGTVVARYEEISTSPSKHYPLLHMGDILAVGENHEALRRAILRRVSHEFYQETKFDSTSFFVGNFNSGVEFVKSQASFTNDFVKPQGEALVKAKGINGATFDSYFTFALDFGYSAIEQKIDTLSPQEKLIKTNQAVQFWEDFEASKSTVGYLVI